MSARDEAIQAMHAADQSLDRDYTPTGDMLDAIPADVLARLAIERGGLIETDKKIVIGRDYQAGYFAPLYRLAEP